MKNLYNGRSTEFKSPARFNVYDGNNRLISSSEWLIEAEDDLKSVGRGSIKLVEIHSRKEKVIQLAK